MCFQLGWYSNIMVNHLWSRMSLLLFRKSCTSRDVPKTSCSPSCGLNSAQCYRKLKKKQKLWFLFFISDSWILPSLSVSMRQDGFTLWLMPSVILIPITNTSSNLRNKRFPSVVRWVTAAEHQYNGWVSQEQNERRCAGLVIFDTVPLTSCYITKSDLVDVCYISCGRNSSSLCDYHM